MGQSGTRRGAFGCCSCPPDEEAAANLKCLCHREREEKTATSQPLGARDASSRVLVAAFSSQHIHLSSVSETCLRVCCGGQGSAQTSKAAEAGAAALVFGHELFAENEIDIEHRPAKRLASAGQDSTNRSEEHRRRRVTLRRSSEHTNIQLLATSAAH